MKIKHTKNLKASTVYHYCDVATKCLNVFRELFDLDNFSLTIGENKNKLYGGSCSHKNEIYINVAYCDTENKFVRCLMHEMVHAMQHEKGQLSYKNGLTLWSGKANISWEENELLSPWEIEATVKSKQLFETYKRKELEIYFITC